MKPILYKLFLLALFFPAVSFANHDYKEKHTKEKKVSKEFSVSQKGTLKIDNSYGNIDISTWDQDRIIINVFIKTNGNNAEEVQKKLDHINVVFNQKGNEVSAVTHFENENKSWWSGIFGNSNNVNMEINYVIKAPAQHNIDIDNDYGAIYMDKLLGNTNISCDYGKIDIGELRGESNTLKFDYTRNSHFGYITNATIQADYSGFTIEEAQNINLRADYSDSNISKVENLQFNCDYGSISVEKARNIEARGDYLSTKIGRVFSSLDLKQAYGSVRIDKLMKGIKNVEIKTDYSGIKLGVDAEMDFQFNVDSSYGGISGTSDLEILKSYEESFSKKITGYYRNQNSNTQLHISNSYANINFKKVP